ncbi:molybdopterin-binding protein [Nocardia sp. NPDC050710]|uniref:molybdopterin-binding protein n=1 Tax=Nocardia sp. NPDC050710 TaxID=3157220 RepID=UPI00340640AE
MAVARSQVAKVGSPVAQTFPPIGVEAIGDVVASAVAALDVRSTLLGDALGATLADSLVAESALPRVDTAAMDGYAVSGPGPSWLLRSEIRYAGHTGGRDLDSGVAVRIATGAPTPRGATAVVRDEFVVRARASGRSAILRAPDAPLKDDTRRRGEHWERGDVLVSEGTRVCAAVVSAAASAETPCGMVRGPVRADVLMTGDEIRVRGPLAAGQTRDSLSPVLPEFLRTCDIRSQHVWHLRDCRELLESWFSVSRDSEMVVVAGATGRGAADHLRPVLAEIGARIVFDGVAMRPGGSQIVAVLPDGRVLLGLPGNPFAAIAALMVTGPAIVDALTARTSRPRWWGRIIDRSGSAGAATRVLPVRQMPGGVWQTIGPVQTPHLADLIGCQALALVGPDVGRGGLVELLPLPW